MNSPFSEQTLNMHRAKNSLVPESFHRTSSARLDQNFNVYLFPPKNTTQGCKQSVFIIIACLEATVNFCSITKFKRKWVEGHKQTREGLNISTLSVTCTLYCDPGRKFIFR